MRVFFLFLIFLVSCINLYSQKVIQGKVIAKDSTPIAGASIFIKGTTCITSSTSDGSFKLLLSDSLIKTIDTIRLDVSYVGYSSNEIKIDKSFTKSFSILLIANDTHLDDVVVIGYGSQVIKGKEGQIVSFPWPPPDCSTRALLNSAYFLNANNLGDADAILTGALDELGYSEKAYFYIPNGFALVTRIEQINEEGESLPVPDRWSVKTRSMKKMSWSAYMKSFFFATPGYFRIIVFTITDKAFNSSGKKIKKETAIGWLDSGLNILPEEIRNRKFNKNYNCTALIYEFEKPESSEAYLITPSLLTADEHLKKSKIIDALKK